jgi:hypothetical protein
MSTGDNYLEWKRRATQAENELRALKLSHERLRKECMDAEARAERAEADNAAKLETAREMVDRLGEIEPRLPGLVHDKGCQSLDDNWADECDCSWAEWKRSTLTEAHPGAALLERLRALEAALLPFVAYAKAWGAKAEDLNNPHTSGGMVLLEGGGAKGWCRVTVDDFRRAVAADALKERKP